MFIMNANMAGASIRLPNGHTVVGDPQGIFEVPDEIGERMTSTPGWEKTDQKPAPVSVPGDPITELRARMDAMEKRQSAGEHFAPTPPAPGASEARNEQGPAPESEQNDNAEPAPEGESEGDDEDSEEGPELSDMTKAELFAVAEEYNIEVPAATKRKVEELRAFLDKEIYGGSE
jgi:hypothetical protein